ncbi:MAG: hypothetical protein J0M11_02255 [Anaerolineae bacterium]|nr:hypothetical protein [Anaerolineae bacterium]
MLPTNDPPLINWTTLSCISCPPPVDPNLPIVTCIPAILEPAGIAKSKSVACKYSDVELFTATVAYTLLLEITFPEFVQLTVPGPLTFAPTSGRFGPDVAAYAGVMGSAPSASITIKIAEKSLLKKDLFIVFSLFFLIVMGE